ncbi:MAG TPA: hypothetical protein VFY84_14435 [Jiangellales bacterium]|nr:hypothetical protein [Jiangellales bacterium]
MTRTAVEIADSPLDVARVRRGSVVARRIGVGLSAAVVAGMAAGLVARLMMRLAAVAVGEDGHFSLAGTAGILVAFVVVAVPGAVLASLVRRRGRSALLVAGALFLCVPATGVAGEDLGGLVGLSGVQWAGVGLATVGVYAAILLQPVLALRLIARWS